MLKLFFTLLSLFLFASCTGKQVIENTNRIKNLSKISKAGVKEEIQNNTKKILRDMR